MSLIAKNSDSDSDSFDESKLKVNYLELQMYYDIYLCDRFRPNPIRIGEKITQDNFKTMFFGENKPNIFFLILVENPKWKKVKENFANISPFEQHSLSIDKLIKKIRNDPAQGGGAKKTSIYQKIFNPKTKRFVKVTSRTGQNVLKQYLKKLKH